MDINAFLELIPTGAENAIPARRLSQLNGQSERQNRQTIEELRGKGILICSRYDKDGGYYLPADDSEINAYLSRQLSRIGSIWKALAPFKRYVKTLPEAEQLDFFTDTKELW